MSGNQIPEPNQSDERETRKLLLTAGTAYGLIFGLGFAFFAWGYDAFLLESGRAYHAWAKLLLGLPITIAIAALAGRLAAMSSSTAVSVALWATVGGLLGQVAGHVPFDGGNLVAWFTDRRLWGAVIFPYGYSSSVRTTLAVIISAVLGVAIGLAASIAVQQAWDRATPKGKMSAGSWAAVLLASIPLALFSAMTVDGLINRPLRIPQQRVGELINLTITGAADELEARAADYRSIQPFLDSISEQYVTHFVEFDSEEGSFFSAHVDVVFDSGFVLRCATAGERVIYCDDFSQKYAAWTDDLVHAGMYGERRWLDTRIRRLEVEEAVLDWLTVHREQLSERYEVSRVGQQSRWILMSVQFDTGFEMTCYFRGARPVLVNQCVETSRSPQ
jgi:hypothetical protein